MRTNEILENAVKNNNFLMTLGAIMVGANVNCRVTYQEYVSDWDYYTGCDTSFYKTKETTLLYYAKTKAMKALLKYLGCLSAEEMAGKWVKESKEELSWGGKLLLGTKVTFVAILGILEATVKLPFRLFWKYVIKEWYSNMRLGIVLLLLIVASMGGLMLLGGPTPLEIVGDPERFFLQNCTINFTVSKFIIGLLMFVIGFRGAMFMRHEF